MTAPARLRDRLHAHAATRWIPRLARRLVGDAGDAVDRLRGRRRPWYVPPRRLRFVGGGEFRQVGELHAGLIRAHTGLGQGARVLDVGCGVGRIAIALIPVLGPHGRYEGFDIVPGAISWCRAEITSRHPNFRFQLADVRNGRYNPRGGVAPERYRFPFPDDSFDLVVATSLFTHMRPAETANYLRESRRVLKDGGSLYATWFLVGGPGGGESMRRLDGESLAELDEEGFLALSPLLPEFAVAATEASVRRLHEEAGFARLDVHHATRGRSQDIVVAA
jgi:SAM-dependent methyltransferase